MRYMGLLLFCGALLGLGLQGIGLAAAPGDFYASTGRSENPDPIAAAREATRMALDRLGTKEIKGVIFYENYLAHPAEAQIGQAVAEVAGNVPTIGVRAIPHSDAGTLWEHSLAVMAIGGKDARVKVASLPLHDDRLTMGKTLAETLKSVRNLKLVMVLSEPHLSFAPEHVSVENFLHGMRQTLGPKVMLFGGNGLPDDASHCAEFINGRRLESSVVVMGIGGPVRFIGTNTNEFAASKETDTVTRARGKWVIEFDGRPAADVYRELSRKKPGEPISYDDVDPIGVDLGDGQIYLRMVLFERKAGYTAEEAKQQDYIKESQDLPIGSLRFVAEVPVGTKAHVMRYQKSAKCILDSATVAFEHSLSLLKTGEKPLLALTSSCCARRTRLRQLDPKADEVRQGVQPAMKMGALPVFGLDAFGELGPINVPYKGLPYQYQQHTFVSGLLVLTGSP
jgi:hypothetical protein